MPIIKPVSDLRNYGEVLRDVSPGRPVFLTRNGHGRAVWLEGKWYLKFSDLSVEALNRYPAGELRRLQESVTIPSVMPDVTKSIVTVTKKDCHTDCHGIVTAIKRSDSVGYIKV